MYLPVDLGCVVRKLLFGFAIILSSCQANQGKHSHLSGSKEEFSFPVILDTSAFKSDAREANWLSTADYEPLYIGKWQDTIYPGHGSKYYPFFPPPQAKSKLDADSKTEFPEKMLEHREYPYYVEWMTPINYKDIGDADVSIKVDTSQRVKILSLGTGWQEPWVDAYPVILKSLDDDTIDIAHGTHIPLIMEAKDSIGNWRPIETRWTYMCGMGVGSIVLPPDMISLTAAVIYRGEYSTSLRLRNDSTFSNEFEGTINYRQFESRFNGEGAYNEKMEY